MTPLRRHVLVPACLAALALPAAAHAQATGGAQAGAPDPTLASASDGAVSVSTKAGGLVGVAKTFRGAIAPSDGGRIVTIERFDELSGQWAAIAHAAAAGDGSFAATWKPDRAGAQRVRARVESPDASAASAAPEVAITLFERARATWYGPGFYGRKTACGQKLSRTLLGVAHKTRPCGTMVSFLYRGKTVTVPVIDRGPFKHGAKWDLTSAAAVALGFRTAATLGALQADSR